MILEVYLIFNGDCEEALHFYQRAFGGKIENIQRFTELKNKDVPKEWSKKVLHADLNLPDGTRIMGADTMYDKPVSYGESLSVSIGFNTREEEDKVFNALSQDARTIIPLQETFWNPYFGMLTDKYGVQWRFNLRGKKKAVK